MTDLPKLAIDGHRMVPARCRVHVRNCDGSPVLDSVSVAVDITDVTFS